MRRDRVFDAALLLWRWNGNQKILYPKKSYFWHTTTDSLLLVDLQLYKWPIDD
jgi:hypothetical protein